MNQALAMLLAQLIQGGIIAYRLNAAGAMTPEERDAAIDGIVADSKAAALSADAAWDAAKKLADAADAARKAGAIEVVARQPGTSP